MSQSSSLRDKRPRTGTFHGHHQTGNPSSTSQMSPFLRRTAEYLLLIARISVRSGVSKR